MNNEMIGLFTFFVIKGIIMLKRAFYVYEVVNAEIILCL